MPKRKTQFIKGSMYHVYNHAVHGSNMLTCQEDFLELYWLLQHYSEILEIDVLAWCFMPNHFHWLVIQQGDIPVSKLPFQVFNVYTRTHNNRHGLRGTLLESRFKVKHAANQKYLEQLFLYIHANPVKAGLCTLPEDWPWSNLDEFIHHPSHPDLKHVFPDRNAYKKLLDEYCKEGADKAA